MLRCGIITMLYGTTNYGGSLQAFALCKYLNSHGLSAEQVLVNTKMGGTLAGNRVKALMIRVKNFLWELPAKIRDIEISEMLENRKKLFAQFTRENIPTSKELFSIKDIDTCLHSYDTFVVGSDQVWHPAAVNAAYLLEFVPSSCPKVSYAASMPVEQITDEYANRLKQSLSDFEWISVREPESIAIIEKVTGRKDVQCCVDPVFLLCKKEWESMAAEGNCNEKYMFCYFLSDSLEERALAEQYAKKHGLIIITFPALGGHRRTCDEKFGDRLVYEATPRDFLSYIKNATCVFTDSFHASAFSIIFEKDFFVFGRNDYSAMSQRLTNLLSICGCLQNFLDTPTKKRLDYVDNTKMQYNVIELETRIDESRQYLSRALGIQY